MAKKFIISINKKGDVSAEISGAKGKKCLDYVKLLETIVEGDIISQEYTQEYYQQEIHIDTEDQINLNSK